MKKFLAGILAVAILALSSCSDDAEKAKGNAPSESVSDNAGEEFSMPDQSFVGVWSTDEAKSNQIVIWEITEYSVKFNTGVQGLFGMDATGVISGGEIIFGDGISPGYSGPDGVKGKLKFIDGSVTVIYEDFGSLQDSEYYDKIYTFALRDENSDEIVSMYKANNMN